MKRLEGKVAWITGSARGIGRAAALRFAEEGARVGVCDLAPSCDDLLAELRKSGGNHCYVRADVSKREDADAAVAKIATELGPIDILVNNAGITRDASLLKMTDEQWQQVISVNLTGVFNCTKAVAPGMVERRHGKIINTSSVVGLYGNFGQTNYAATKSGVIGLTKTWARELGPKGICVNAVAPGFIATEMANAVPAEILEQLKARTPLRRLGEPIDVANAYLFLASDESNFVNGAVLSVDGGLTL